MEKQVKEDAQFCMPPTHALAGLLRLPQIIGDPDAEPPIPPIIPVSRSSWLRGVKDGKYPKPVRLGPRTVAWRSADIQHLLDVLVDDDASLADARRAKERAYAVLDEKTKAEVKPNDGGKAARVRAAPKP